MPRVSTDIQRFCRYSRRLHQEKVNPPGRQPDGFDPKTLSRRARAWVHLRTTAQCSVRRHTVARKRMLSPEMFTSETVAGWPLEARWTWAGVLTYLDDFGYGQDSPALVKATVWPHDDTKTINDVEAYLSLIANDGSLCRFECCGQRQMHAPKWSEWQTVAHPSKARRCVCTSHSRDAHEEHLKASRKSHETLALREVNSSQKNVSDSHELSDCLRPDLCHFHRQVSA